MLNQFFIICSGADTDILNQCPKGEQNKYAGIGATIFFTAIMATIACSYALYTIFNTVFTSVFFGCVWGLLIFNLDRYIISTIKKTNNIGNELIQALPRIILALIIAIVISKPLELKIFEKEINQLILEDKNQLTLKNNAQILKQFTPKIKSLKHKISLLQNEITTKEAEVNQLYNTYIAEAEGTAGTKLTGKGPVYKEKRDKHDALLRDLQKLKSTNKAKIEMAESEISLLQKEYKSKINNSQPIINNIDGLMSRIKALDKLPWLPSFFIFLLFLAIETSPIIAKLLSNKGIYDLKLEDYEDAITTDISINKTQRKLTTKTHDEINDMVFNNIIKEKDLHDYKKDITKEIIKLQSDRLMNKQKKTL